MSPTSQELAFAPDSKSAEDMFMSPVWSILGKGQSGAGKTVFANGKEFRPSYTFDFEGRFEAVPRYYKKLDGHCKDVSFNHFPLHEGFYKPDKKMDAIVARPEYKTIVVSSLTSFIRNTLIHLKKASAERVDPNTGRPRGVRKKGGIQANILEDYNFEDAAVIDELIGFLQECKSLGMNVFLEAHITPYDVKTINEETGEKDARTQMEILTKGKKAPAEVPGWFNEVWLFEKVAGQTWDSEPRYRVNPRGNDINSCKTSFGITPFDWTSKDGTVELFKQLSVDDKEAPRVDPSAPKVAKW